MNKLSQRCWICGRTQKELNEIYDTTDLINDGGELNHSPKSEPNVMYCSICADIIHDMICSYGTVEMIIDNKLKNVKTTLKFE